MRAISSTRAAAPRPAISVRVAPRADGLADLPVVRAAGRDLRRVGDDEHLRRLAQRLQPAADGVGGGAADAAVDLVEDQRQARACGR